MAVPNPEHLFDQADRLVAAPTGPARQVDLRRAVSSAYYGVFHALAAAAADEYVGATKRSEPRYGLAYRSIDHRVVTEVCVEATKAAPSPRYARYVPAEGFGSELQRFAAAVIELQGKRYAADYDPGIVLERADAALTITAGRAAVRRLSAAPADARQAFLALLLFRPR
ncbi:MAG TPA: hypothetical protein VM434_12125 [Beijerinckiaceae bacterium]|nr:hypothetical protein [Beijerinckiaceae bacterium]